MEKTYLYLVASGVKTIESRCYMTKREAYENVKKGHIIYFRESGKFEVWLRATALDVVDKHGELTVQKMLKTYQQGIAIPDEYIAQKNGYKYLSLIWLKDVTNLRLTNQSFYAEKHDMRGWVCDFHKPD
jgi:ASC-1-like (ASCH) protein